MNHGDFNLYELMRIMGNFTLFKKKHINWILTEPSLLYQFNELCKFLDANLATYRLDEDGLDIICFYVQHLSMRGLHPDRSYIHVQKHFLDEYNYQQNMSMMAVLYAQKKCGNLKCKREYIYDCVDTERDDNRDDDEWWDTVKRNAKWKICKGCKTTYYCSRKCQKISWIHGHKEQCQALQKLISYVDEQSGWYEMIQYYHH